ncbi:MAG TPA: TetR/AcrR family transcriptional regulator [Polyangiaceae bacterium]|nr:TetR/AcrR family transcriptional regulator [Polyangiaceae bacterium]
MPKPRDTKRRRLDAGAARALILDATERRLVVSGPSGIRLQEVAADAGVSHPTVLHHFGSREHLVKAVIARSLRAINASLVEAIHASSGDEAKLEALVENVAAAFERSGHARVVLWLALEGQRIDSAEAPLSDVVDAAHALRLARRKHKKPPTRDDTARTVVLAALTLMGGSVLGVTLLENAGLGSEPRASVEFRRWLAHLLIDHLDASSAGPAPRR